MDLGLGEHRAADPDQETGAIERLDVLPQVGVALAGAGPGSSRDGH